ncbi:MAG: AbrB family transcriptional regulator [Paracoccaceae bacterium]
MVLKTTAALIGLGALAGFICSKTLLPLPWMLGPLLATALLSIFGWGNIPSSYQFPHRFRMLFIAVIGVMIGSQITWKVIQHVPNILPSLLGLIAFIGLALSVNFLIFRRLGGYDPATAFFCSAPGGLLESIALGETYGCDSRILTLQQFLRVIFIIILVPSGLSLWMGSPVGSAAGLALPGSDPALLTTQNLLLTLVVGLIGLYLGRRLKLPAGQLIGPALAAGLLNLSGYGSVYLPNNILIIAQIIIGVSLGSRFVGFGYAALRRSASLGLLSALAMLSLALALSALLSLYTGLPFDVLLISLSPGGVTEMSLIALSLRTSPALITVHHMFRITATVILISGISRFSAVFNKP